MAAGDENLFERKRSEAATGEKIAEITKAQKRHPEADSLAAAVFGDPVLFDLLHEKIREGFEIVSLAVQIWGEPKGASEQLADLREAVGGIGPGTSLADRVSEAQAALAGGDDAEACEWAAGTAGPTRSTIAVRSSGRAWSRAAHFTRFCGRTDR